MSLKDVLIDTARNPATANTFNYASMAHNNHFYFSTLVWRCPKHASILQTIILRSTTKD